MNATSKDELYLEAIKLSLLSLHARGINMEETFRLVLDLFSAYQEAEPSEKHLSLLNLFLQAGRELGLGPYMSCFPMNSLASSSRKLFSLKRGVNFEYISASSSAVGTALGKWSPSSGNSHRKKEAVDEILDRLRKREAGTSYYYTAAEADGITRLMELHIEDRICYLRDVGRGYLYLFRPDSL